VTLLNTLYGQYSQNSLLQNNAPELRRSLGEQ